MAVKGEWNHVNEKVSGDEGWRNGEGFCPGGDNKGGRKSVRCQHNLKSSEWQ